MFYFSHCESYNIVNCILLAFTVDIVYACVCVCVLHMCACTCVVYYMVKSIGRLEPKACSAEKTLAH